MTNTTVHFTDPDVMLSDARNMLNLSPDGAKSMATIQAAYRARVKLYGPAQTSRNARVLLLQYATKTSAFAGHKASLRPDPNSPGWQYQDQDLDRVPRLKRELKHQEWARSQGRPTPTEDASQNLAPPLAESHPLALPAVAPLSKRESALALLGLLATDAVTPEMFTRAYRKAANNLHPDKYPTADAAYREQLNTQMQAANQARQLLVREQI